MAVIWGLDLHAIQWSAFSSNNMWHDTTYHLRRTKFIVYQLAMILCVVSESLGTAALSDYVDQQKYLSHQLPTLFVHNNAFVAIASSNIFVGIYVATIFGAAFFFDLFWPARRESRAVKTAWKICSVVACALTLACAIAYTYVVAAKRAWVTRPDGWRAGWEAVRVGLVGYHGSTLRYQKNGRAVASVVFLWVGMVCTFASTYLLWRSIAYIDAYGPKSTHARTQDEIVKPGLEKQVDGEATVGGTSDSTQPQNSAV